MDFEIKPRTDAGRRFVALAEATSVATIRTCDSLALLMNGIAPPPEPRSIG